MIIKRIDTIQEIDQIAGVEAETWGMKPGETVPDHLLMAIASEGGLLLGAYHEERLIGFTLGWLGTLDRDKPLPASEQLKLVSHMTGVLEQYRDQGIGYKLKLAQREWALDQGLDLVTWTYDPLESRNGYFNIHLLGSTCEEYLSNYYGEMSDEMNQGIPSDRFRVEWWITSPEVEIALGDRTAGAGNAGLDKEIKNEEYTSAYDPKIGSSGFIIPPDQFEIKRAAQIYVEIPADYQRIRQADLDLAMSWRLLTRQVFEEYFNLGYRVVDFFYQRTPAPRSWYVLELKS